jgi:hypothetical protein
MKTERALPHHAEGIDVVTLFAPSGAPRDEFEWSITEWISPDRAVLVVLPCDLDAASLERLSQAGADLCVVTPTPAELFTHIERARRLHHWSSHTPTARDTGCDRHRGVDDDLARRALTKADGP